MFSRDVWYERKDFSGMTAEAATRYADDLRKMYMGCLRTRTIVFGLTVAIAFCVFGVLTSGVMGIMFGMYGMAFGSMLSCAVDYEHYWKAMTRLENEVNEITQSELYAELAKHHGTV